MKAIRVATAQRKRNLDLHFSRQGKPRLLTKTMKICFYTANLPPAGKMSKFNNEGMYQGCYRMLQEYFGFCYKFCVGRNPSNGMKLFHRSSNALMIAVQRGLVVVCVSHG